MTAETAFTLGSAIMIRDDAARELSNLARSDVTPYLAAEELVPLAEAYVHEQRIINRIVSEARDD